MPSESFQAKDEKAIPPEKTKRDWNAELKVFSMKLLQSPLHKFLLRQNQRNTRIFFS